MRGENFQKEFKFQNCFCKKFCSQVNETHEKYKLSFSFISLSHNLNLPDLIPVFLFPPFIILHYSLLRPRPLLTYFLSPLFNKKPSYLNCLLKLNLLQIRANSLWLILSLSVILVKSFLKPKYERTKFTEEVRTVLGGYRTPNFILFFS